MNEKKIIIKGDGIFSREKIEINKDINENVTIAQVKNYVKKMYKKIIGNDEFYFYVMTSDLSCGFIPTPEHTIFDLINLFGTNETLLLKVTNKLYFG